MGIFGLRSTLQVPDLIVFGSGTFLELGLRAKNFGTSALVIRGGASLEGSGNLEKSLSLLKEQGIEARELGGVKHDPDETQIMEFVERVKSMDADLIIGIGGGSVIDTAKAVSIIAPNGGTVQDYWEGRDFTEASIPYIAVPTTSGTGAEITKNAVITSADHAFKKSIRSELMIPNLALVDPLLTLSMPPEVTADTGLDALVQNLEAYTSRNAGPVTDTLAHRGIELSGEYLLRAYKDGSDVEAREALSLASLFGGITLANAGLGLSHGLAHPLGIGYGLAHGRACALTMPRVIQLNYPARREKYDRAARLLKHRGNASEAFELLLRDLGISTRLGSYGVREEDIPEIVEGSKGGSRGYNPIDHSDDTVAALLREML
jgi:alcohol dehydrogenase class IV